MKIIPENIKERLSYNPLTGQFIWAKENKMHPRLTGMAAGFIFEGYLIIKLDGVSFRAHRLAWFYMTNEQPTVIDHINGVTTDNRFDNLRNVTTQENAMNHGRKTNKSGLPCGVRKSSNGRYQARITIRKKVVHLGTYDDIQSAKTAYETAKTTEFKEYARAI